MYTYVIIYRFEATILDYKNNKLLVHFNGWHEKWNEWIDKSQSSRFANRYLYSKGPHIPPKKAEKNMEKKFHHNGVTPKGVTGLRNLGNTCFVNTYTHTCILHR